MRGLKYSGIKINKHVRIVALYTSAWIEIFHMITPSLDSLVALYTSAWIEIVVFFNRDSSASVALYTSAWIEMS